MFHIGLFGAPIESLSLCDTEEQEVVIPAKENVPKVLRFPDTVLKNDSKCSSTRCEPGFFATFCLFSALLATFATASKAGIIQLELISLQLYLLASIHSPFCVKILYETDPTEGEAGKTCKRSVTSNLQVS